MRDDADRQRIIQEAHETLPTASAAGGAARQTTGKVSSGCARPVGWRSAERVISLCPPPPVCGYCGFSVCDNHKLKHCK